VPGLRAGLRSHGRTLGATMRRWVPLAAGVVILAVVAVAVAVRWSDGEDATGDQTSSRQTTTTVSRASATVALADVREIEVGRVQIGSGTRRLIAVGGGAVWLVTLEHVIRVDEASGAVAPVPDTTGSAFMTFGERGLFVLGGCPTSLKLVGAETGTVERIFDGIPNLCGDGRTGYDPSPVLTTGSGAVWVLVGRSLWRVDVASGEVATIALPEGPAYRQGSNDGLAASGRGVWVGFGQTLRHISAATNAIDLEVPLGDRTFFQIASAGGQVWVVAWVAKGLHYDFQLLRVGDEGELTELPPGPVAIFGGASQLWFSGYFPQGVASEKVGEMSSWRVGWLDTKGRIARDVELPIAYPVAMQAAASEAALWVQTGATVMRVPNS
jgi:hypothetical protein